ncbi:hypothetical protein FOZ63_028168, partial [Perkinsus olseni]
MLVFGVPCALLMMLAPRAAIALQAAGRKPSRVIAKAEWHPICLLLSRKLPCLKAWRLVSELDKKMDAQLSAMDRKLDTGLSEIDRKINTRLSELSSDVAMPNEQVTELTTFTRR